MADFPNIAPTSRSFEMGDWPVKTYKAQSGAEIRILYGNRRTNMTMSLEWRNISSTQAASIMDHYIGQRGTFQTFAFGSTAASGTKAGWDANDALIGAGSSGNAWRYAGPPTIETVKKDTHVVTAKFVGVF
jgi:hypothetical protein